MRYFFIGIRNGTKNQMTSEAKDYCKIKERPAEINEEKVVQLVECMDNLFVDESTDDTIYSILVFLARLHKDCLGSDLDILEQHAENLKSNFIIFVKELKF